MRADTDISHFRYVKTHIATSLKKSLKYSLLFYKKSFIYSMGREVKNRKTGRCAEGRAHGAEIEMMRENKMEKVIKKLGEKKKEG